MICAALTRGDPQAPLLWTAKSLRNLAAGLRELGHRPADGRTYPQSRPQGPRLDRSHYPTVRMPSLQPPRS
jgi:hypothetical protein